MAGIGRPQPWRLNGARWLCRKCRRHQVKAGLGAIGLQQAPQDFDLLQLERSRCRDR